MIQDFLAANWRGFLLINGPAGAHPWLDQLMIFSASDLIVLLPVLVLALWVALASWSPLKRWVAGLREEERLGGQRAAVGAAIGVGGVLTRWLRGPLAFAARLRLA